MSSEKAGEYLVNSDWKNFPERESVNERARRLMEEKGKGTWLQKNKKIGDKEQAYKKSHCRALRSSL